jgi:hypothetical protein
MHSTRHRSALDAAALAEIVLAGAGALAVVLVALGALPPAVLAVAAAAILNALALG